MKIRFSFMIFLATGFISLMYVYYLSTIHRTTFEPPESFEKIKSRPRQMQLRHDTINYDKFLSPTIENNINNNNKVIEDEKIIFYKKSTLSPTPSPTLPASDEASPMYIPGKLSVEPPSVLIVGGTDGSGTRKIVELLSLLGTTMVSEDPETYDIHGDIMGGWPPVVNKVISHFKSLNYNPIDLTTNIQSGVLKPIQNLLEKAALDSHKPQSHKLAVGGVLRKPIGSNATNVKFGFKAPVAMTLIPLFHHLLPRLKFIHVLRDGRDIALSANQGPVDKFYSLMYPSVPKSSKAKERSIQAIQLWSDWNSQIYDYCISEGGKNNHVIETHDPHSDVVDTIGGTTKHHLDYLSVNTEAAVSLELTTRFAMLIDLAKYIGSSLTNHEICCLAQKESKFMGSHQRDLWRTTAQSQKKDGGSSVALQVNKRYGKWRQRLKNQPDWLKLLHDNGKVGLDRFMYNDIEKNSTNPLMKWEEHLHQKISKYAYQCNIDSSCSTNPAASTSTINSHPTLNKDTTECIIQHDTDYTGKECGDLDVVNAFSFDDCCHACGAHRECHHFTLDESSNLCYLKQYKGTIKTLSGLLSGDIPSSKK